MPDNAETVPADLSLTERLAPLYVPTQIGRLRLRNRFIQPAMHTRFATEHGQVTDRLIAYHAERARGGVALIVLENTAVDWERGRATGNPVRIDHDRYLPGLHDLAQAVQREGAAIAAQLHHSGRQNTNANMDDGGPPLAPSAIRSAVGGDPPREMTVDEIHATIVRFAAGARRAVQAGFDAIEIHGAHGYLLTQFLSPATNRRSDDYGGPFPNRARFPQEVVAAVRAAVGPDFPIIYRINAEERIPGGTTLDESVAFCRMIEPLVDAFNVTAGNYDSMQWIFTMQGTAPGALLPLAEAVKRAVSVPVAGISRLGWMLEEAAAAVAAGRIDLVALGRTQLADPQLVNKTRRGEARRVRRCIACNGCAASLFRGWRTHCVINPELGVEYRLPALKRQVVTPKRVLIVGGGISGCEAARVAAERGHQVVLVERENRLGGLLWGQGAPQFKRRELDTLIDYYAAELAFQSVEVRLGVAATEDLLDGFDSVLLATGTVTEHVPDGMLDAVSILCNRELPPGDPVTVVGSSYYGSHAAAFALEQGRRTRLVPSPGTNGSLDDANPLLAAQVLDYLTGLGLELLEAPTSLAGVSADGGIILWAPHARKSSSSLQHLVDGDRVRELGTRLDPLGGLYEATQSGFWAATAI